MSFISKIFGSKNKKHASLVINDAYLEVVQLAGGRNNPELIGINRIKLEDGVVVGGEIRQESAFQDALQQLFKEALPNSIQPENLCINIPFEQIYSFVKSFSKHTSEDLMLSEIEGLLKNEAPFNLDELERDYQKKVVENKVYYGVTAYPKRWKKITKEACNELGFNTLHFFTEPEAQLSLANTVPEGDFVLFSWLNGKPYLSVFYHGLLYDSYFMKDFDKSVEVLIKELKKESQNFENKFSEPIKLVYFAGFPQSMRSDLKSLFDSEELLVTYLCEAETFLSSIIPVEEYSTSLVGLAMKAFEL